MKKVLYLTIALFVLITVIVILGNVITIGEKMTAVIGVPYLEYAFYLLLLVLFTYLVYLAILQPMMKIHNAPEFPVLAVQDNDKGLSEEAYRKQLMAFGDKLCNNCYYMPTSKRADRQAELKTALADVATTQDISQLKSILNDELKQRYRAVDKHIITYATKVFVITAISSSNRIDTLATLGLNYRMISDIVQSSGFRPNKIQLVKIYYYVISSAFLSYFFQGVAESAVDALSDVDDVDVDIDVSDVEIPDIDASNIDFTQYVRNLNLPGIPLAPLADGLANGIMTIAIGYITKYYLQKGSKELKGAKGRTAKLKAKMKALTQVPLLLAEIPTQLGNTGLTWAMKGFEKAYKKMSKNKSAEPEDFVDDMDGIEASDIMPEAEKSKGKGIFGFWR
ncbi:MAG: DUF697 domain-containing protein [Bacteroidaceae bacterium]|nr:DUF697 domain-containing protein [Bacteroidaceae bacterium]